MHPQPHNPRYQRAIIERFEAAIGNQSFITFNNSTTGCTNDCLTFMDKCTNISSNTKFKSTDIVQTPGLEVYCDTYNHLITGIPVPYGELGCEENGQNKSLLFNSMYTYIWKCHFQINKKDKPPTGYYNGYGKNIQSFAVKVKNDKFIEHDMGYFDQTYQIQRNTRHVNYPLSLNSSIILKLIHSSSKLIS